MNNQAIWEVVGGRIIGGLSVLEGPGRSRLPEMLSFAAMIQELEVKDNLMRYALLKGSGPPSGWVQIIRYGGTWNLRKTTERPRRDGNSPKGSIVAMPLRWDRVAAKQLWPLARREEGNEAEDDEEEGAKQGDEDRAINASTANADKAVNGDPENWPQADIVIASDCVSPTLYGDSWEQLIECMEVLMAPRAIGLLSFQVKKDDNMEPFFHRLKQNFVLDRGVELRDRGVALYVVKWSSSSQKFQMAIDAMQPDPPHYRPTVTTIPIRRVISMKPREKEASSDGPAGDFSS